MYFVKVALILFPLVAFGLGEEFSEQAPMGAAENQSAVIAQLKQQAVANRIKEMIGADKFGVVEKVITKEFADRYVVDYKTRRVGADKSQLEVTGHLDLDGMKRWVRLTEARWKGQSSTNLFILSSTIPGLSFSPSQTAQKVRESTSAQAILAALGAAFHRINQKVTVADTGALTLSSPPKTANEIRSIAEKFPNYPGAVWSQLVACKTCGGMRLDTHVYQLGSARTALVRSDDIALSPNDIANVVKLKAALKNVTTNLQSDLEDSVSKGGLSSQPIELTIEGVAGYQAYRSLTEQLEKLDYVSQAVLVAAQSKTATFETLTSLPPDEFSKRIEKEGFLGFRLKTQSVESRNVSVRYLQ